MGGLDSSGGRVALVVSAWLLAACGRVGFAEVSALADGGPDAPVGAGFEQLAAYGDQTCALRGGRAYCWGANDQGQLGDTTKLDALAPTQVALPAGTITRITPGQTNGCAVVDDALYCWGNSVTQPVPLALAGQVTDVGSGASFTCAIVDGGVQCLGENGAGQLGDGSTTDRMTFAPIDGGIGLDFFQRLSVGDDHACAIGTGAPVCWGHNDSGALGNGDFNPPFSAFPLAVVGGVMSLPRIAGWHACALDAGTVRCWGRNDEGALGDGTTTSSPSPVVVDTLTGVTAVTTGGGPMTLDASCAIVDAEVHCWGAGAQGRLGNSFVDKQLRPQRVEGVPGLAVDVAIGFSHSCALVAGGDIYCWGTGDRGQLGDGTGTTSLVPVRVLPPP